MARVRDGGVEFGEDFIDWTLLSFEESIESSRFFEAQFPYTHFFHKVLRIPKLGFQDLRLRNEILGFRFCSTVVITRRIWIYLTWVVWYNFYFIHIYIYIYFMICFIVLFCFWSTLFSFLCFFILSIFLISFPNSFLLLLFK